VNLQRCELLAGRPQAGAGSDPLDVADPPARRSDCRRAARAAIRTFQRNGLVLAAAQGRVRLAELDIEQGRRPLRLLTELRREAQSSCFVSLQWRIEAALARLSAQAHRPRAALAYYRRAIEEIEHARLLLRGDDFRIAFLHDKLRVYEELVTLLLESSTPRAL